MRTAVFFKKWPVHAALPCSQLPLHPLLVSYTVSCTCTARARPDGLDISVRGVSFSTYVPSYPSRYHACAPLVISFPFPVRAYADVRSGVPTRPVSSFQDNVLRTRPTHASLMGELLRRRPRSCPRHRNSWNAHNTLINIANNPRPRGPAFLCRRSPTRIRTLAISASRQLPSCVSFPVPTRSARHRSYFVIPGQRAALAHGRTLGQYLRSAPLLVHGPLMNCVPKNHPYATARAILWIWLSPNTCISSHTFTAHHAAGCIGPRCVKIRNFRSPAGRCAPFPMRAALFSAISEQPIRIPPPTCYVIHRVMSFPSCREQPCACACTSA
ncbi:hypothetical protein HYPSUDRAFT_440907 [Hypholoma sublateritium FD-334 SS-4]|uniref:Uncharacterized protein n=1 Tax=Hypholoma sublateritium (strain FD-334 SS-4) TaxID=945553 RepID=A0A0D2Q0X2_HYPSF|nr:hypothetical protein HYPSUDRAFT_440907 [Hypholoma sublateritium FD-334 SS-4]